MTSMTTTAPEVKPKRGDTHDDLPIAHYRREREERALCGKRLRGIPAPPEAEVCVVCKELVRARGKGVSGSF
jgi:hypothetical protein